jgi:hypothetical protein
MPTEKGAAGRAERPIYTSWKEVFEFTSFSQGEVVAATPVMEYLCETCAQTSLVRASLKGTPTELFYALKTHVAKGHKLTKVR